MKVVCPHCQSEIKLSTRENQTVAGCHICNGTFKIEVLSPESNKSKIVPERDESKVLCPHCSRKVLIPNSLIGSTICCPDCNNNYKVEPKNVIFSITDCRVATGTQLKDPVRIPSGKKSPTSTMTLGCKQVRPGGSKKPSKLTGVKLVRPGGKTPTKTVTSGPSSDQVVTPRKHVKK